MSEHLMHRVSDPRSAFEAAFEEDYQPRVIDGHVLLPRTEYDRFKADPHTTEVRGRLLLPDGTWSPPRLFPTYDLSPTHRVATSPPTPDIVASMDWEDALEVDDVDRFYPHYGDLEAETVAYFEGELRHDPGTVAILEGVEALVEHDVLDETAGELAAQAAMFHRAGTDPVPGSPPTEVVAIIAGSASRAACRHHCEHFEEQAAAAAIHTLMRWRDGLDETQWAMDALEEPRSIEDAREAALEAWARPAGSLYWLLGTAAEDGR